MKTKRLLEIVILLAIFSSTPLFTGNPLAAENSSAANDKIVATIKEETIRASQLAEHIAATKLPRDEALNDLIELKLLRSVATAKGVNVPAGRWNVEEREKVEYALVKAVPLPIPAHVGELVVDHAFVKLSQDEKEQKVSLDLIKQLRSMAVEGATIPEAFNRLQVDGSNWHIGDHEEYPVSAMPDEIRELSKGELSNVLVSSDGYSLFKIYERKIPLEEVSLAVRIYLLEITSELVNIFEE
jgi:hypothetical protein